MTYHVSTNSHAAHTIRRDQLIPYDRTLPVPTHGLRKCYDIWGNESTIHFIRDREITPPNVPDHPIGSWLVSSWGVIDQLIEVSIAQIMPVETVHPYDSVVQKYVRWLEDGHTPPPVRLVDHVSGNWHLIDGHHRLCAARLFSEQNGIANPMVRAWLSWTWMRPGNERHGEFPIGLTHEFAILDAIRAGLPVDQAVIDDYPAVAATLAAGRTDRIPCPKCDTGMELVRRDLNAYRCSWCTHTIEY